MLGLTDGNLSAHSRTLDEAGYIVVEKTFRGRRPYTAMRLTPKGRRAFGRYLDTLRQIVDRGDRGGDGYPKPRLRCSGARLPRQIAGWKRPGHARQLGERQRVLRR